MSIVVAGVVCMSCIRVVWCQVNNIYQEHTVQYFHRDTYCIVASTAVNEQYAYLVDTGLICTIYSLCSLGGLAPHTPQTVVLHAYDLVNYHNHKRAQSFENGSKTIPQTESLGVSHGIFCQNEAYEMYFEGICGIQLLNQNYYTICQFILSPGIYGFTCIKHILKQVKIIIYLLKNSPVALQ